MAQEIELKLSLPESAQRAFLRHPLLKSAEGKHAAQLTSIYYDTPDLKLRRAGIALRVRRHGKTWLQTVKCAGEVAGGLSARPEWETPYAGHFDFSAIDDEAVRARLEKRAIMSRLEPLFETSFRRATWRFDGVLLMFDRGWIAAGGRREAISEIELELTDGGSEAEVGKLFALAEKLAARLPLTPAPFSKAERGLRLHLDTPLAPEKAGEPALIPEMAPLSAFRVIALSCLDQLQRNHEGALRSEDPEYIHQMRVATRRLRACMRLFAPLLPDGFVDDLVPRLRKLMGLLGAARDLDVLLTEIVAPVVAALPDEPRLAALAGAITDRRHSARVHTAQLLGSHEFAQSMLHMLARLHEAPFDETTATEQVTAFADARLKKLRRKVRRLAEDARVEDVASLHALRIGIKRHRYALEFFAPVARGKARRRQAGQLATLQGTLGELNDLANAGQLLTDCAGHDERLREAVSLIAGWHGQRHARLMAAVPKLLANLRSA